MLNHTVIIAALSIALVGPKPSPAPPVLPSLAQATESSAKADAIVTKLRKIDLLNRIVPLLLTKDQLKTLLAAIEKARENVKNTKAFELKTLIEMEPAIDKVLDKALENGEAPGMIPVKEFGSKIDALTATRSIISQQNEAIVYDALWPILDKGQKKAIAGTINPRDIDPKLSVSSMTDEQLVRLCIRDTLLDPTAYPILIQLLKLKM